MSDAKVLGVERAPRELARLASGFGAIRILERADDGAREYWQGQALHSLANPSGESLFGHIHAMAHLMRNARTVLVLGGAGGSLATLCARQGAAVTVVEIEPQAHALARTYFNLDPRVRWITGDAAAFMAGCSTPFDGIALDAFDCRGGARLHDEAEKILAIAEKLTRHGVLTANLAGLDGPAPFAWDLTCALAKLGAPASLLRALDGEEGNEILWLRRDAPPCAIEPIPLAGKPVETHAFLGSLRAFAAEV